MTILAIYTIGLLLVFAMTALPYMFGGDGLEVFGIAIAAVTAIIWPIVLAILIWDGINLCLKKLSIIS